MTYPEAIQYLYGLRWFGTHFGLENPRLLAAQVGDPQKKLRFIHVAGTNGKGSTCAMLESIYRASGLRVGMYTSPHLVCFRERIQVNRQMISESEVVRLVAELRSFNRQQGTTLFEFATIMALMFFAQQKCDLVIWETGLGGRLDATNLVAPLASVITNIAFDHQQWLGNTLEKIAAEKAGIIKPGVPVITAAAVCEARDVIARVAQESGSPVIYVSQSYAGHLQAPTNLLGDHQKLNAALALAVVEALQSQIPVTPSAMRAGMAGVEWPGRLQLVQKSAGQKILLDGAHNVAGAKTLCAALEKFFPASRPVLIFGALEDKQWPEICSMLAPLAGKVFTVPVASERTAKVGDLMEKFRLANPAAPVKSCGHLADALSAVQCEPLVVITGSLYLVGEALEQLGLAASGTGEPGLNEWTAARIGQ